MLHWRLQPPRKRATPRVPALARLPLALAAHLNKGDVSDEIEITRRGACTLLPPFTDPGEILWGDNPLSPDFYRCVFFEYPVKHWLHTSEPVNNRRYHRTLSSPLIYGSAVHNRVEEGKKRGEGNILENLWKSVLHAGLWTFYSEYLRWRRLRCVLSYERSAYLWEQSNF